MVKNLIEIKRIKGKDAARTCARWHYSGTVPGASAPYGIWEDEKYIGCIVFGYGASCNLGKGYGFDPNECCELVRIALSGEQKEHTTKYVAAVIKVFKAMNKNINCIFSFSDLEQNHIGTLYQAGNWLYLGVANGNKYAFFTADGTRVHSRTIRANCITYSGKKTIRKRIKDKHRYAYPLSRSARKKLKAFTKPYPSKRGGNGAT